MTAFRNTLCCAGWLMLVAACARTLPLAEPTGGFGQACNPDDTCNAGLTCGADARCVTTDPCLSVACSGHGTCQKVGTSPRCVCDAGYYAAGTNCVAYLLVEPVYPNFADWNEYVQKSAPNADIFHQPETACAGSESGIGACIHGGELRRVVVTGRASCVGLSITDSLGVFTWQCQDASGTAIFYSSGLKPGHGLGDLVQTSGFNPNAVTVSGASGLVAQSLPEVWGWDNLFAALPDNSAGPALQLTAAGTIYVAEASATSNGYNIAADRIAVVALPGVTITYAGSASDNTNSNTGLTAAVDRRTQLASGGRVFLWLEGDFDARAPSGLDAENNLLLAGVRISRVQMFRGSRAFAAGIELHNRTQNNELRDVRVEASGGHGIVLLAPGANDTNWLDRVTVEGAGISGLRVDPGGGDFGLYTEFTASNCNSRADGGGVELGSNDNRVYYARTDNNNYHGFRIHGDRNRLVGLTSSNNKFSGFRQWNATPATSTDITVVDVVSINNGYAAIFSQVGLTSTFAHVTGINTGSFGSAITLGEAGVAARHTLVDVVVANSVNDGVHLNGGSGSDGHLFAFIAATHSGLKNVSLLNAGHRFTGGLWVSQAILNCQVGGATNRGVLQDTCTDTGADLSNTYTGLTGPMSDAVLHISVDLTNSFVGKVSNDASNASGAGGTADVATITDWTQFENPFRGWGLDGSAFPGPDHRGRCEAGTCRIWDARLRASDTRLLNVFGAFVNGATCPASVSGASAEVVTDQQTIPNTFLAHAIELVLDGRGDDDGLCESNEACIYAPNLGAYQGEGLPLGTCTFVGGIISGVQMFGYPINGG